MFRVDGAPRRRPDAIAGRSSSTRPACRIATTSARSPCSRTRRRRSPTPSSSAADDPAAISYLKEQQWTNGFATALVQEAEMRRGIRVPAVDRAAHRRRGHRRGAGRRPLHGADACLRSARACRPGRSSGGFSRGSAEDGADRATLAAAVAEAQAALDAARADLARAERLLAERAVPGAARRGGAARGEGRRGAADRRAGAPRAARRDAAHRRRRARPATRSCCARRSPAASPRCLPRSAPPTTKARRCSASCAPTAWNCRRTCRRPTRRSTEEISEIALEMPGRPDPLVVEARSHARRRRHRPEDARAAGAVRRRQPRAVSC